MRKEKLQFEMITGKKFPVYVQVGTYQDGSIAVSLVCADYENYGLPFMDVTKHVGNDMPPFCAAVKNYSENKGMVDFLIQNGFGKLKDQEIHIGYFSMPVFQFDKARLQALDPQGFKRCEKAERRRG